jgi:hypothetical protein
MVDSHDGVSEMYWSKPRDEVENSDARRAE